MEAYSSTLVISAIILAVISVACVVWMFLRLRKLEQRLEFFLQGKDARSLEQSLKEQIKATRKQGKDIEELFHAAEYLQRAIQSSIRKIAFERYNPFPGVGGNQSFTLVLLDAHNAGVIVTSLHGREGTRVYAKAVRSGKALQNLSEEEDRVLRNATMMRGA
jgi:hypothetical protein